MKQQMVLMKLAICSQQQEVVELQQMQPIEEQFNIGMVMNECRSKCAN